MVILHLIQLDLTQLLNPGQILPQIHSFHTEVKEFCAGNKEEKKRGRSAFLVSFEDNSSGLLLLSSSPLKFLDCFPVKGQATAPIANVKCKNTIAAKKQTRES